MGITSNYVKHPFPSIFKKKHTSHCRGISKLLAEPDIQQFINKLSTNNQDKLFQELSNTTQIKI
jgi:hypothetical protein